MNKIILPLIASVLLLTSCSQALYKNSYDWIKVAPKPTAVVAEDTTKTPVGAAVVNEEVVVTADAESASQEIEIAADSFVSIANANHPIPAFGRNAFVEKMNVPVKQAAAFSETKAMRNIYARAKDRKGHKRTSGDLDMDYEMIELLVGMGLVMLFLFGGPKVRAALLIAWYTVQALLALAALCLIIYGIFWLFFGDWSLPFFNE